MSENIFKEIYTKVLSLFKQTEKEENAKDVARNRLRVVLMQDRTNLTPELLQRMRKELVELLSRYVEMDKEALELNFDQEGDQMALMLSIPVIRAKDEAEIEKALAQVDENAEENDSESDKEKIEDEDSEENNSEEKNEENSGSETEETQKEEVDEKSDSEEKIDSDEENSDNEQTSTEIENNDAELKPNKKSSSKKDEEKEDSKSE